MLDTALLQHRRLIEAGRNEQDDGAAICRKEEVAQGV